MKTWLTPKLLAILLLNGDVHHQIEGPLQGIVSLLEVI